MQTVDLDFSRFNVPQRVCAKQGDVGRKFQARITDNGEDYPIPEGAQLSIWYTGTSGGGNYSMVGENSAFHVEGSTVTVEMIAQMLKNRGGGTMCLMLHGADGTQLGLWNIQYLTEPVPGMDSPGAVQYYTALTEAAKKAADSAARAEAAAQTLVIDTTLSKAGQAADAANAGGRIRALERLVKTAPLPIENGGTGAATAAEALENLGVIPNGELLWENASPLSSFASQTITLPETVSRYNGLRIICRHSATYGYTSQCIVNRQCLDGCVYFPEAPVSDSLVLTEKKRYFHWGANYNTELYVQQGRAAEANENTAAIPIAVYGCNL